MKKIIASPPDPVIPPLMFTVNGEASLEEILKRVSDKTLILDSNEPDFNVLEEVRKCDWNHHPETRMYAYCRKSLGCLNRIVGQQSVIEMLWNKNRKLCSFHQAIRSFFRIEQLPARQSEYRIILKENPAVGEIEHINIHFAETPIIRIAIKQKTPGRTLYFGEHVVVVDREASPQPCPFGE